MLSQKENISKSVLFSFQPPQTQRAIQFHGHQDLVPMCHAAMSLNILQNKLLLKVCGYSFDIYFSIFKSECNFSPADLEVNV